jgi:hypothetical protein
MAGTFPRFRLYASDGVTLVHEFDNVTEINDFQDPASFVEHTSLRGQGSIITEGSSSAWDMNLTFMLIGSDYEDLVSKIETVIGDIDKFTKYILKIDKTPSSTVDYKVMRLSSVEFPLDARKKRVNFQKGIITFRVDSWA